MKNKINFLSLLVFFILWGCNNNSSTSNTESPYEGEVAPTTEEKTNETLERKLIKDGMVEFETDNINLSRKIIFDAVRKYKGYVSSDQEVKYPRRKTNTLVIRIPDHHFDDLLNDATQGVEQFKDKEINVKNVTEEFLDIQARMKTKKELELRYIALLKQAKNVTEILEIEKQIEILRSEIESIEGRLKFIEDRVSFSMLKIILNENTPNETNFGQKFKNGFSNGWENLVWFFVFLVNSWPFILIGLGLFFGIRYYVLKK